MSIESGAYMNTSFYTHRVAKLCIALAALFSGSCGSEPKQPLPARFVAQASLVFPDSTLTDLVSYTDQVSVVTIVSEHELMQPEVLARGEGYVGRKLKVRIDETLWTNDGRTAQSGEIEMLAFGWVLKGEQRIPLVLANAPRLSVGGRYVLPLVEDEDKWNQFSPSVVMPVSGNAIAEDDVAQNGYNELAQSLTRKGTAHLNTTLASAVRESRVERFRHLPAFRRIKAVKEAAARID